jgi:hypothetical protein
LLPHRGAGAILAQLARRRTAGLAQMGERLIFLSIATVPA